MQLTEGILFHDRYTLVKLIGCGGFSEVWLANDKYTGLELALKIYAPNGGTDDKSVAIFSDEIRRVYDLSHPNLLKPQHFAVCEGMPYIVMPYCANGSVVTQIEKMSEAEIWTLLHDVATEFTTSAPQEEKGFWSAVGDKMSAAKDKAVDLVGSGNFWSAEIRL